jgi:hypothetical protein
MLLELKNLFLNLEKKAQAGIKEFLLIKKKEICHVFFFIYQALVIVFQSQKGEC